MRVGAERTLNFLCSRQGATELFDQGEVLDTVPVASSLRRPCRQSGLQEVNTQREMNKMAQEERPAWPGLAGKQRVAVSVGRCPGHVGGAWMYLGEERVQGAHLDRCPQHSDCGPCKADPGWGTRRCLSCGCCFSGELVAHLPLLPVRS